MTPNLRLHQLGRLATAIAIALVGGTIGFHGVSGCGWLRSFYSALATASLAGIDTSPRGTGALILSIVLVVAGLTIIAYAGAVIVEAIAGGVFTGVLAERRRELLVPWRTLESSSPSWRSGAHM